MCLLLLLGGCAAPQVHCDPLPDLGTFSASGHVEFPDRWWTTFADPALDEQVHRALGDNLPLGVAVQRLRAARAVARREASDLLPDLDGVVSTNSLWAPGRDGTVVSWGWDVAYQVDLWGQIESRVDAERFRASATEADVHAVALLLAADVARTWFSLVEAYAQLELLERQVQTNRNGLKAQELRFGSGFVRSPDVLRQRQLVESTLEQAVVVRARVELLEHQLAVLQGELPQGATYDPGEVLPELPPLPATGLPSELVQRRPDVRRDYLAFVAADHDLAAAVSAQYPRLDLTASLRNIADPSTDLFRNWFLSLGSQLIAPLFDGGQRRAEVDRTAALKILRFQEYGQTVLTACQEVEDNLASEHYQIQRIERLQTQVELAQLSSAQLFEQYLIGDAAYLDVLSAIQAQQRLQRDILSARLDLILIRIGLYLALAGDFDPHFALGVEPAADIGLAVEAGTVETVEAPVGPEDPQADSLERLPPVEPVPADEIP